METMGIQICISEHNASSMLSFAVDAKVTTSGDWVGEIFQWCIVSAKLLATQQPIKTFLSAVNCVIENPILAPSWVPVTCNFSSCLNQYGSNHCSEIIGNAFKVPFNIILSESPICSSRIQIKLLNYRWNIFLLQFPANKIFRISTIY